MARAKLGIVILAAGEGKRMKSARPKVLHAIGGRPLLGCVLDLAASLAPEKTMVVAGAGKAAVEDYVAQNHKGVALAHQESQKGTGHAVACAKGHFGGFKGDILVLYGDVPLVTKTTLTNLLKARKKADFAMAAFEAADPTGYGRVVLGKAGVERIIEEKDAGPSEKKIILCNAGILAGGAASLFGHLAALKNDNAAGEYYLTDVVALARKKGESVAAVTGDEKEFQGVNTKKELSAAEAGLQEKLRTAAMDAGATLIDPSSVYFSRDTELAPDVTVWPHVVFGPGVVVERGAVIYSFSHLEGCHIRENASIGPFARLRPGADIGEEAKIGNFVEVKNATIEMGAKANHLSYIGDAGVGAGANIGAGTITCNYDGRAKHFTDIGSGAFIGSNAALVAPVKIGDGAVIGAGSVITKDVAPNALALTRPDQMERKAGAKKFKKSKQGKA